MKQWRKSILLILSIFLLSVSFNLVTAPALHAQIYPMFPFLYNPWSMWTPPAACSDHGISGSPHSSFSRSISDVLVKICCCSYNYCSRGYHCRRSCGHHPSTNNYSSRIHGHFPYSCSSPGSPFANYYHDLWCSYHNCPVWHFSLYALIFTIIIKDRR